MMSSESNKPLRVIRLKVYIGLLCHFVHVHHVQTVEFTVTTRHIVDILPASRGCCCFRGRCVTGRPLSPLHQRPGAAHGYLGGHHPWHHPHRERAHQPSDRWVGWVGVCGWGGVWVGFVDDVFLPFHQLNPFYTRYARMRSCRILPDTHRCIFTNVSAHAAMLWPYWIN